MKNDYLKTCEYAGLLSVSSLYYQKACVSAGFSA